MPWQSTNVFLDPRQITLQSLVPGFWIFSATSLPSSSAIQNPVSPLSPAKANGPPSFAFWRRVEANP